MSLPPLPNLTPAIVYQPWEVNALVRSYGEACFRAGMEQAAAICAQHGVRRDIADNPTSIRIDTAEVMARKCAAAIRAAAKQGGQG